jgi:hypothetical protein
MKRTTHAGRYVGPRIDLQKCRAILRPDPRSRRHVLAQFDEVRRFHPVKKRWVHSWVWEEGSLTHGWHRFKRSHFRMFRSYSQCGERQAWNRFYRCMSRSMPGHTEQEAMERGL